MNKLTALVLIFAASSFFTAAAQDTQGLLDATTGSDSVFVINGTTFKVSPDDVVGISIEELEVGDTVRVTYDQDGEPNEINAMTVDKVE